MPRNNHQFATFQDSAPRRIEALKIVILVALGIILVRLFFIQIIEHGAWVAKADEQHTMLETITAKRGEIYMMDHDEPVAVVLNQTTYQIVIDPTVTQKEDIEYVINTYAKDYQIADIDEVYNTEGLRYSIIAKNVPRATAEKIAEAGVPAIWLKKTNQRVYPEGQLASGLLGFVNDEGEGQYGTEGSLNKILAGEDGLIKATADVNKVALSIGNDNIKILRQRCLQTAVPIRLDRHIKSGKLQIIALDLGNSFLILNNKNPAHLRSSFFPHTDNLNVSEIHLLFIILSHYISFAYIKHSTSMQSQKALFRFSIL